MSACSWLTLVSASDGNVASRLICSIDGVLAIDAAGTRTRSVVERGRMGRGCGNSGAVLVTEILESGEELSGAGEGVEAVGDEPPDSGTKDRERPRSECVGGRERERFLLGKTA